MINLDLNNIETKEIKTIEEGTDIPVTISYVDTGTQNLKGSVVECLVVTLKDKNDAKLYHRIPMTDKFAWKIRSLFIAAGLSKMENGKEVISTQEEYELVGKEILIDTEKNGQYTNVKETKKIESNNKKKVKTETEAAIDSQLPKGKKLKTVNTPPEFGDKLKENLDF